MTLSQELTFRCLVCSMGMPSESRLPGPGMTRECCQTVNGQSLAFLGTFLVAPGPSLYSSGLPAAIGTGMGAQGRGALCSGWLQVEERALGCFCRAKG